MKTPDNKDEFIRKLILQKGIEKAPDHFTDRLMSRIKANPATDNTPILSAGTWIAIIAGLAAMIVVIFTINIPFFDNIFSSSNIQKVSMNIFSGEFFNTMAVFFKGLKISGISIVIMAAAVGLVILDRLLRRRFSETKLLVI
jgi:hypothetical protein